MVTHCPSCGGEHLRKMGFGTQRLEEELKAIVPDARVLRMDADTTMSRNGSPSSAAESMTSGWERR